MTKWEIKPGGSYTIIMRLQNTDLCISGKDKSFVVQTEGSHRLGNIIIVLY